MSENDVNTARRRFLVGATSVVGGVGAIGAAVPFVASWNPSAKAKAAGAPVRVNIDKIEPGQQIIVEWRGKPVWVIRRSESVISDLTKYDAKVADPASDRPQQPEYAKNQHRSRKPDILVLLGVCTHLGCSPQYQPNVEVTADLVGRFYCPCHGSVFDMAGRVFKAVPAPTNLEVPPYSYVDDSTIIIGVDEETA